MIMNKLVKRNFNVALTSDYVGPGVDGKTAEKRGTVAFAPDYVGPGVDGETSAAEKRGGGEGGCGPSKQGLC